MQYRLHPPFAGRQVSHEIPWEEIDLTHEITIDDFLRRLVSRHPALDSHIRSTAEDTFHHLLLFRQDTVLETEDVIRPDDRIEIMMPLTGG